MKRRGILIIATVSIFAFLSLFPTWNFSESIRISQEKNPLWDSQLKPINSPLTQALHNQGLSFQTERGAEADPDGICFGDFGSDEYWVVQYNSSNKEVHAYSWIVKINWIGHLRASRQFNRISSILEDHIKSNQ